MLLVRCHVVVHHLESCCNQVINGQAVLEKGIHLFSLAEQGEVKRAILLRADYVVVEVKIEVIVHRHGSNGSNDIYPFDRFIICFL